MSTNFSFCFNNDRIKSTGNLIIKKLKNCYHTNHDYFHIDLLEMNLCINNNNYSYYSGKMSATIALKNKYLNDVLTKDDKSKMVLLGRNESETNRHDLIVVKTYIQISEEQNTLPEYLLRYILKNIFIGNEKYLLKVY